MEEENEAIRTTGIMSWKILGGNSLEKNGLNWTKEREQKE